MRWELEHWIAVACAVLGVLFIWASVAESKAWQAFAVEHKCKVVGRKASEAIITTTGNGQIGVGSTSPQTGWLCDDGVTYWR